MKNLKISIMSGLTFFVAMGAAFAFNVSGMLTEQSLFREVPGTSPNTVMVNITTMCTLIVPGILCSAAGYPSEDELYWYDAAKTQPIGGIPTHSVFLGGDEWY